MLTGKGYLRLILTLPVLIGLVFATGGCSSSESSVKVVKASQGGTEPSPTPLQNTPGADPVVDPVRATPSATARPSPSSTTMAPSLTPSKPITQENDLSSPSMTEVPTVTQTPAEAPPTPTAATAPAAQRIDPEAWKTWPVIPVVSQRAREIYLQGIQQGTNPNAFSKVGDCQNITNYFLGVFDDPRLFRLGPYDNLQLAINHYTGSFSRNSQAVKGGFNVASVLSAMNANQDVCQKNETPLACEFRLHNPSIVIISMETWWAKRPASLYEGYLRQIVDFSIQHGAVPILATKADNLEGDETINLAIARTAYDYDVPLWNFWAAVQSLPDGGLTSDGFHLTFDGDFFNNPRAMQSAWPNRNLTALQALDAVWRAVSKE